VIAERFPARALSEVLRFDVVPLGAAIIVVIMRLLDRVERMDLSHSFVRFLPS
jgi:hypothetical protein